MDKKIKKNYLLNSINQVLVLIIPLITTPYLSRVLEPDGIGIYSYKSSITAYFVLFATFGISCYGQRAVSYCQDDVYRRSVTFWETTIIKALSSSISLLFFLIMASQSASSTLYYIMSLNIISCLFDISWFYQGIEDFKSITIRNLFFKTLNVICILIFVRKKSDIYIYSLITLGGMALNSISLWMGIRRHIRFITLNQLHPLRRLPVVLSLFAPSIAIEIYTVLDKTMIGWITKDSFQSGYYEQALKITKTALAVVTSMGAVMMSRIGHYHAIKEKEKLNSTLYDSFRFVWFISIPICFGLIAISNNFVPWLFGKGYDDVSLLIRILSPLVVFIGISNVTGIQYLVPVGRQKDYTTSVVAGAIINLILNMILIPKFQSIGAAFASTCAELTVSVFQLLLIRKEVPLLSILKLSIKYLIAGLVMIISLTFLNRFFKPSILSTLILIIAGAAIYFLVLLIEKDTMIKEFVITTKKKN